MSESSWDSDLPGWEGLLSANNILTPRFTGPNGASGAIVLTVRRGVVTVPVEVSRGFRMWRHRRPEARIVRAFYIAFAFDTSAVEMANDDSAEKLPISNF